MLKTYTRTHAKAARAPRGIEGYWQIILDLDRSQHTWTASDVEGSTNADGGTVRDFIRRLVAGGFAVMDHMRVAGGTGTPVYRLLKRQAEAPRIRRNGDVLPETRNAILWRAIRMAKTFTAPELASLATTDEVQFEADKVRRFLRELVSANILIVTGKGARGLSATYRLVRNIGPLAPMVLRGHAVFDPNTNAVLPTLMTEVAA